MRAEVASRIREPNSRAIWKRILVVAIVVAALAAGYANDLHHTLGLVTLRAWVIGSGIFGPVLFVVLFAALAGVGAPAFVFLISGVAIWPVWPALLLNWAGGTGAGIVGYSFARWVARDWVAAHLPERFRGLDARIGERGLSTVIFVRLMFFMAPFAHWALGLTRVDFGTYVWGTTLGLLPWMILWTFLGDRVVAWLEQQAPLTWLGLLLGFSVVFLLVNLALNRLRVRGE